VLLSVVRRLVVVIWVLRRGQEVCGLKGKVVLSVTEAMVLVTCMGRVGSRGPRAIFKDSFLSGMLR
jgi:hypothetical protein